VIILESDAVGVRNLGMELRVLLAELRERKVPWDLLTLSFIEDPNKRQATRRRKEKFEVATRTCVVSSGAYIISKAGAASLLRRAHPYRNVEKLIMSEMTESDFRVITPERDMIHFDDIRYQEIVSYSSSTSFSGGGGRGGRTRR